MRAHVDMPMRAGWMRAHGAAHGFFLGLDWERGLECERTMTCHERHGRRACGPHGVQRSYVARSSPLAGVGTASRSDQRARIG